MGLQVANAVIQSVIPLYRTANLCPLKRTCCPLPNPLPLCGGRGCRYFAIHRQLRIRKTSAKRERGGKRVSGFSRVSFTRRPDNAIRYGRGVPNQAVSLVDAEARA